MASTEKLHEEIKALKLRVRDLEQALEVAFEQVPNKPYQRHPLLEPELLLATQAPLADSFPAANEDAGSSVEINSEDPLVNQFGTMQISKGRERWLGVRL